MVDDGMISSVDFMIIETVKERNYRLILETELYDLPAPPTPPTPADRV